MGPVVAALPVIFKVVAVVSSAVTMIKGLKEGNLMQAVIGGIGAVAGLGALSASAAAAKAGTTGLTTLGGEATMVGDTVVNNAGGALGAGAQAAAPAATAIAPTAAPSFSLNALSGGMGGAGDTMAASLAAGAPAAAPAPSGGLAGLLGDVGERATGVAEAGMEGLGKVADYALENKDVLANVGGGLLKGYSEGKLLEEKWDREERMRREGWDREERLESERRARAGYTPRRTGGSYKAWAGNRTPAAEGGER
jgi:hypothetical protein